MRRDTLGARFRPLAPPRNCERKTGATPLGNFFRRESRSAGYPTPYPSVASVSSSLTRSLRSARSVPRRPAVLSWMKMAMIATPPFRRAQVSIRELYEGGRTAAHRFRYALLVFDLVTLLFIVATSFVPRNDVIEMLDVVFGIVILADFRRASAYQPPPAARPAASGHMGRHRGDRVVPRAAGGRGRGLPAHPAHFAAAAQLPAAGAAARDSAYFRAQRGDHHRGRAISSVFLFVMTGFVYETQHASNPHIINYADALYFTVTALTTTGFGDITLPGTTGRLISVVIMIFGVTLFFRLAEACCARTRCGSPARPAACCVTIPTRCTARPAGRC